MRNVGYEESLAEAKKFFALRGDSEVAEALARGYAQGGYAGAVRLAADTLAARSRTTFFRPLEIASLYASAGENDIGCRHGADVRPYSSAGCATR